MKTKQLQNIYIYLAFMAFALTGMYYGRAIEAEHEFLRVWTYGSVLMLLIGFPFILFQQQAGVPDFLSPEVTSKNRFLLPALIGIIFGVLDVMVIKVLMHPEPYTTLPPFLQPFPYSIFLYTSGALDIEIFYRLIPLTVILLAGKWIRQGKYYDVLFWTGAVLTAIREPLEQLPDGSLAFILYSLITGFLMNFLQAVYFKRAGFMATVTLRLGHYLVWHILLGVYVEFIELAG
jgi:hypothetical protein